ARDGLARKEQELVLLHGELQAERQVVVACQQSLRTRHAEREAKRSRQLELLHARTRRRNTAADQQARLEAARSRLVRLDERLAALTDERARLAEQDAVCTEELASIATRERILAEREQSVADDLRDADAVPADL